MPKIQRGIDFRKAAIITLEGGIRLTKRIITRIKKNENVPFTFRTEQTIKGGISKAKELYKQSKF